MYFWREIQIPLEIIFAAINLKKIKDDYSGNLSEKSAKCGSLFRHFLGRQYVPTFFVVL